MSRVRLSVLGGVALLIAGLLAANAHLVFVAITSQPDCVLKPSTPGGVAMRAAKPSC